MAKKKQEAKAAVLHRCGIRGCAVTFHSGKGGRVGKEKKDALCPMHLRRELRGGEGARDPGRLTSLPGQRLESVTVRLQRDVLLALAAKARAANLSISAWAAQTIADRLVRQ